MCFAIEDSSFWFRHRNNCILYALKSFPPRGTFFDIGGGNGYVARAIQDAGIEVVLVEPGAVGARNAKKRGIRQIVQATLDDAQFKAETIPSVGLFDVVEHIEDDRSFLESLYQLLCPNGRVYLTVPAFQVLWSSEDIYAGHRRRYTLRGVTNLLLESGYKIDFATYFFGFLPIPILLARAFPYRLGLTSSNPSPEQIQKDHRPANLLLARALDSLTGRELRKISSGHMSRWGGSCLVIAHKAPQTSGKG